MKIEHEETPISGIISDLQAQVRACQRARTKAMNESAEWDRAIGQLEVAIQQVESRQDKINAIKP